MRKILLSFCVLYALVFTGQVNLDSGLVACYALNGNAYEPINNLHGSSMSVTPQYDRFNIANSTYSFTGFSGSYVELPDNSLFNPNSISFSAWIKPIIGFSQNAYILSAKDVGNINPGTYDLSIVNIANTLKIKVGRTNVSLSATLTNTTALQYLQWHHVCFSISQDSIKIYLNGILENKIYIGIPFGNAPGIKIYLGSSGAAGNAGHFKGLIDNARFYNRVLSPVEVNQLYTNDPACITATAAPVGSFSVTSPLCVGQPVSFNDLSANYPSSWNWTIPGGTTTNSLDANPVYIFTTSGVYTASLVNSNAVGSYTSSANFTVNSTPTVVAVANPSMVCQGNSGYLIGSGASSYSWSTGQTGIQVQIYPMSISVYTVTGSDTLGCINTSTVLVRYSICDFFGPLAISENNADYFKVLAFPNPTSGKIEIEVSGGIVKEYEVLNVLGSRIFTGNIIGAGKTEIDLYNYPNGIYFVKLKNDTEYKTIKLIKE